MNNILNYQNSFILTRYLYVYDEVKIALLLALLEKREESNFWAYELYYSGFKKELIEWLWIIYYDFFATLNPSFESYFLTKEKDFSDMTIKIIVENLLIRSFNTDVFMLSKLFVKADQEPTKFILTKNELKQKIKEWIVTKDFKRIAEFVLSYDYITVQQIDVYELFLDNFPNSVHKKELNIKKLQKMMRHKPTLINKILLSKIMTLFVSKYGKSLYMHVTLEEIEIFKTVDPFLNKTKSWQFLNTVCNYPINGNKFLGLFPLERNKLENLRYAYNFDWLFYASRSPIWLERIQLYKGIPDAATKTILFPSDDEFDDFHNTYDYEPDEQTKELKEKVVPAIINETTWIDFQKQYNTDGRVILESECLLF